jgi:hypothetical protein
MVQEEISRVILGIPGKADRFTLRWGWLRFRLAIRPLTTRMLIRISGELSNVRAVDENREMFPLFIENVRDIRYFVNSIAIATGSPYQRIIRSAIRKLPLADIQQLFAIVQRQCDMERFFFICISAKGLQVTKSKQAGQ